MRDEYTRTIEPARALAAETLTLERTLSELVNQAYALNPAEIALDRRACKGFWRDACKENSHRCQWGQCPEVGGRERMRLQNRHGFVIGNAPPLIESWYAETKH